MGTAAAVLALYGLGILLVFAVKVLVVLLIADAFGRALDGVFFSDRKPLVWYIEPKPQPKFYAPQRRDARGRFVK
jgi:hypothetical protein